MLLSTQKCLLLGILLLCSPLLLAQDYKTFTNTQEIFIPDAGPASVYPSQITVSGLEPYLEDFNVHFKYAYHDEGFEDVDMLLEAPNGQKVILSSDAVEGPDFFLMLDLWFGNSNLPLLTPSSISLQNMVSVRPSNFQPNPDNFPAPGPGMFDQPNPSLHVLDGINPNGVWKLWIVDDKADGASGYLGADNILEKFGWEITLKASATPVCSRPDLLTADVVEDSFAIVSWTANGTENAWDLYFNTTDTLTAPTAATAPTLENVGQHSQLKLAGLQPYSNYVVWVRSDCGAKRSPWIGPLRFRTKIYPCKLARKVQVCEFVSLHAEPHYTGWNPTTCTTAPPDGHKRVIEFTPPVSGTYKLVGFIEPDLSDKVAYRPAGDDCDTVGWKCLEPPVQPSGEANTVDLQAGISYWFYFNSVSTPTFRFSLCRDAALPSGHYQLAPIDVWPTHGRFRWFDDQGGTSAVGGNWDIFYQPAGGGAPTVLSTPTESDIARDAAGYFELQQALLPGTTYQLYARQRCSAGSRECWDYSVPFETPTTLTTATNAKVDTNIFLQDGIRSILSWDNSAPAADNIHWKTAHGFTPSTDPEQLPQGYTDAGAHVGTAFDGLGPARTYDLWLQPQFFGNVPPYWRQEWQGPFPFTLPDYCDLISEEIFCGSKYSVGESGGIIYGTHFFDLPPTACAPDSSESSWEKMYRFRSPVTGPVSIVPLGAEGAPGRECLVFYKKASDGCWIAGGWQHLGCWEMGTTAPTLSFQAEKDSLYFIAFDGRHRKGSNNVRLFAFRLDGCGEPCPLPSGIRCLHTDDSTALISWNNLGPGIKYTVEYQSLSSGITTAIDDLTDTSYTVTGLVPGVEYELWVRYFCQQEWKLPKEVIRVMTGSDHPYLGVNRISHCNPYYRRPEGQTDRVYLYDMFDIQVPVAGTYTVESTFGTCIDWGNTPAFVSLYTGSFDPADPQKNLLAYTDSAGLTQLPNRVSADLQPGQKYLGVVAWPEPAFYFPFSVLFDACLKYGVRGPAFPQVSALYFQGRQPEIHGKLHDAPEFSFPLVSYWCPDTTGWLHLYLDGPDGFSYDDDYILYSIEDFPERLDASWFDPHLGGGGGARRISNPPAAYAINPSGWFVMDRFWDINVYDQTHEPTRPLKMRFYFTDHDFQALRDSVVAAGGIPPDQVQQLFFYKINDYYQRFNPDPAAGHAIVPAAKSWDSDGYWEYQYGPEASDTTWAYQPFLDGHQAEMLIRHFSGGGGGVGGNLQGATVFVRPVVPRPAVQIYPNPASDWLLLDGLEPGSGAYVRLTDMQGHLHLRQAVQADQRIDMRSLPAGVYFLTLETRAGLWSWKVVKIK